MTHGDPKLLLAKYGLDADGIYTRVKESIDVLDDRRASPKNGTINFNAKLRYSRARLFLIETDGRVVLVHDIVTSFRLSKVCIKHFSTT